MRPLRRPAGQPRPEWRQHLQEQYPHWGERIDEHATRVRPTVLSETDLIEISEEVNERCGEARKESTWEGIATVVNQFEAFEIIQTLPSYRLRPLDRRMLIWLQYKIRPSATAHPRLGISSAVIYYRKLHQLYRLVTGSESPLMREYGQGLAKDPESVPSGERPLAPQELRMLLREARSEAQWAQLYVQWTTASRTDDLQRLVRSQVTLEEDLITLQWDRGTKSGVDKRLDVVPAPPERLTKYLKTLSPTQRPFPLTATILTRVIRSRLEANGVSPEEAAKVGSHSIKKGALAELLMRGTPLDNVLFKAKHSTSQNLQTYVGPLVWAEAHAAAEMSVLLSQIATE
jgi:hypothetical protein